MESSPLVRLHCSETTPKPVSIRADWGSSQLNKYSVWLSALWAQGCPMLRASDLVLKSSSRMKHEWILDAASLLSA